MSQNFNIISGNETIEVLDNTQGSHVVTINDIKEF